MSRALGADAGNGRADDSGDLIGFSLEQLLWGLLGDRTDAAGRWRSGPAIRDRAGGLRAGGQHRGDDRLARRTGGGACAGVVLARAMRATSSRATALGADAVHADDGDGDSNTAGPIVGGQILGLAGWRAIFWTLVGVGLRHARRAVHPARDPAARAAQPREAGARLCPLWRTGTPRALLGYAGAAASSTAACSPTSPARPSPTSAITMSRRSSTACCSPSARSASWRPTLSTRALVTRIGGDPAAAGGDSRGGPRGRGAGGDARGPGGRPPRADRPAVRVRLRDRVVVANRSLAALASYPSAP